MTDVDINRGPGIDPSFGKVCIAQGCDEAHAAKGWCATHYGRWSKGGRGAVRARGRAFDKNDRLRCSRCGQSLGLNSFYKRNGRPVGQCVQCCRTLARRRAAREVTPGVSYARSRTLAQYNLPPDEYASMSRNGCMRCAALTPGGQGEFHIDHDHNCCGIPGRKGFSATCGTCTRGILCNHCNREVGWIEWARRIPGAVIPDPYLDRWEREGQWWKDHP